MRAGFPDEVLPVERLGRVHFVGIGGAALSGIARLMLARGVTVSGSDTVPSATLDALRGLGALCFVGHDAAHVAGADTVVVSTAIRDDNPEVVAARRRGLRVWPRSAAMVSVMAGRTLLAVTGTHGKTTTTSLLAVALRAAGADPSYAIGADLTGTGHNAHLGGGDLFVAEADESDGAFLTYSPTGAVVTNIEADHLDSYGTEDAYREAFSAFLDRIVLGGFLVASSDDPGAATLAGEAAGRGLTTIRVGTGLEADVRVIDVRLGRDGSAFSAVRDGAVLGRVDLQIPGRHYVLDAALALATGLQLDFDFDALARGMASHEGTKRRMEHKGESAGVEVYDSYAHHPTEIAGDIAAARTLTGSGRLVVCFQPHLVSRTRIFAAAMGAALSAADAVVVTDVYVAREEPDPSVTGELVADAVTLPDGVVHYEPDLRAVPAVLARTAAPGDLVLTLGAGDVTTVGPRLLELLDAKVREPGHA